VAASTRSQANLVLEKLKNVILPNCQNLKDELVGGDITISGASGEAHFLNTSAIKVVTATESSRGNRANILALDEFRTIKKDMIDIVFKKFLGVPRMPGYLTRPEYAHMTSNERSKQLYLSSAWYAEHWGYAKFKDIFAGMMDQSRKYFACALPYQVSIKEGLLLREEIEDEMLESDFNEVTFQMEREALFWGDSIGSFFEYTVLSSMRTIKFPMLPAKICGRLPSVNPATRIPPRKAGEIRLLSLDIALMSSERNKNDASALFINQLLPTADGRFLNNFVYTESYEGEHTADQALRVRRHYKEFDCSYVVIDVKGVGAGVADALVRDIIDPDTGEVYPAFSCCNDEEWASRCKVPNAEKALWVIRGSAPFNSECALTLRNGFRTGKIRLLVTEQDGEDALSTLKGWSGISPADRVQFRLPYLNTTLLINELIRLEHDDSGGLVKIISSHRKDRYSSASYSVIVARELERKTQGERWTSDSHQSFSFKQPTLRKQKEEVTGWEPR
jgi:hypothetical protein